MSTSVEERHGTIIIGGGIIGLSVAYYLVRSGNPEVTVIERGRVASEASSGNAGGIWPNLHFKRNGIRDFGDLSLKLFGELAEEDHLQFEFRKNGVLELLPFGANLEAIAREIDPLRDQGYGLSLLTREEAVELEPNISERIGGAIHSRTDANANSYKLATQIEGWLRNRGIEILESTSVEKMTVDGGRVSIVKTSAGEIRSRVVVNAAGPWSRGVGKMVGLSVPVEPAKGYMLSSTPQESILGAAISDGDIVVTQRPNGIVRIGGTVELSGFDRAIDRSKVREIMAEGGGMVPRVSAIEIAEEWTGLRPYTPDGLPIVGFSQKFKNLIYATGHFRRGFELAPATGKVVSEIINGDPPSVDIAAMSPSRFGDHNVL